MDFRIDNLGMLLGLFALAIPVAIHLLQRRRFDILDWGAMQFLPESLSTPRRRWLDEIILLLIRMTMMGLIVLALATPFSTSAWLAPLSDHSRSDIVLVLDGSYSMDLRLPEQPSPWQEAVRWARTRLGQDVRGERFALVVARQGSDSGPFEFSSDRAEVLGKLDALPAPHANPDMPHALAEAWLLLQSHSQADAKEIIVLTDRQLFGWADPETLATLENLGYQWRDAAQRNRADGLAVPSVRVVKVSPDLPKELPNYTVAPITASRGVATLGQQITLRSALHLDGFPKFVRPRRIKVTVDGKKIQDLPLPEKTELTQGQIPLTFQHRFDRAGRHNVSFLVEADARHDVLPADNEQSTVVEVVKDLQILLVDGAKELSAESSTFFVQRALGSSGVVNVPYTRLKPTMIVPETAQAVKPAVIVLADVPRLDTAQLDAIERFLAEGGGLLIAAGERVMREKTFYNEQLFRQGQGWLPAGLDEVGFAKDGVQPDSRTFHHTALELFRTSDNTMSQVRFSHWCKVGLTVKERGEAAALLSNGDPFLLEKSYRQGRVMLSTVPFDRRWDSTLPNVWEFPILVHEIVDYLAGSRHVSNQSPLDLRESNLTRCNDADWHKVEQRLPGLRLAEDGSDTSAAISEPRREDLWWLLLVAVLGLLCAEVWMTGRMVRRR